MLRGDVANELHDDNGLTNPGAAEGAHLAPFGEGGDQVDNLDSRLQHLGGGLLLPEGGRGAMDGPALLSLHRPQIVQGLPHNIEQPSQGGWPHGDGERCPGVDSLGAPLQAIGGGHGKAAHPVVPHMLLRLEKDRPLIKGDLDSVIERRQLIRGEFYIDHGADYLGYFTFCHDSLPRCSSR